MLFWNEIYTFGFLVDGPSTMGLVKVEILAIHHHVFGSKIPDIATDNGKGLND